MKKSLLLASLFALCALLINGSFSSSGYAKVTKKKAAQVEKTSTKATISKVTTSKETSASAKSNTKSTTTKSKTTTSGKSKTTGATELLQKSHGTSQAEINALIQQSSGANSISSSPAVGEEINWQVLAGGGGSGSSTNFGLISVIGQTAVGLGSSANFNINHGFLQDFGGGGGGGCCVTAGDYDNNGSFNIADVTAGIARIFSGGAAPSCQDQADYDSSGAFNIADVTAGIARIFSGGGPPVCGPCGC